MLLTNSIIVHQQHSYNFCNLIFFNKQHNIRKMKQQSILPLKLVVIETIYPNMTNLSYFTFMPLCCLFFSVYLCVSASMCCFCPLVYATLQHSVFKIKPSLLPLIPQKFTIMVTFLLTFYSNKSTHFFVLTKVLIFPYINNCSGYGI